MGNESETQNDYYITFELIQSTLGLDNPALFKKYLHELSQDLSAPSDPSSSNSKKIISRLSFYDFIKVPIFIGEKLFSAFSTHSSEYLFPSEFEDGFFSLYMGTFEETSKVVFNLLDFNKDGKINKEDVKIVLSYLPLRGGGEKNLGDAADENDDNMSDAGDINENDYKDEENKENNKDDILAKKIFGDQMKSLKEIEEIVNNTFIKMSNNEMDFNQFLDAIRDKGSDVYLQIICFLYDKMPFTSTNVNVLKTKYKEEDLEEIKKEIENKRKENNNINIDEDGEVIDDYELEYEGLAADPAAIKKRRKKRSETTNYTKLKISFKNSMLSATNDFMKKINKNSRRYSYNIDPSDQLHNELKLKLSDGSHSSSMDNNNKNNSNKNNNTITNKKKHRSSSRKESSTKEDSGSHSSGNNNILDLNYENSNRSKNNPNPYGKNVDIVRLDNEGFLIGKFSESTNHSQGGSRKNSENRTKDLKKMIDSEAFHKSYDSPSKYLEGNNNKNKFGFSYQLRTIEEKESEGAISSVNSEDNLNNLNSEYLNNNNNNLCYENWIYKFTHDHKIRKYYLVMINKDIFYYKSDTKKEFLGMHNLSGCFIQENDEKKIIDGVEYFSFDIYFNNKGRNRRYYTPEKKTLDEFIEKIKLAIGYTKFSDLYEMKQVLGKGKFGVVNLGIHKKTGKPVAIKIINKDSVKTIEDKELVRIEIGILKLCHHPNIVRLLDHLENTDHIYIVMEYIEGGTLGNYFKKKKFSFTENQARNIMLQIASGLKYLHQYGIVHRDLKPDNIMITKPDNTGIVKIMDFGLSKICSKNEKMVDGYGTLSYVAPEVLLRTPYNNEVDIWSMGVILFYMLCGHLPFRGNKEQIVAEKIVYNDLEFNEDEWCQRSSKVQDLISSCMEKKMKDRINIEQFLNHPWFSKCNARKYSA